MKPRIIAMIRQRVPDRFIVAAVGCSTSYVHKLRSTLRLPAVERIRK